MSSRAANDFLKRPRQQAQDGTAAAHLHHGVRKPLRRQLQVGAALPVPVVALIAPAHRRLMGMQTVRMATAAVPCNLASMNKIRVGMQSDQLPSHWNALV